MAYNKPAFRLPFGIFITNPEHGDVRYGPYTGIGTGENECFHVDSPIATEGNRIKGLTIGILVNGTVVEYWFNNGLTNSDLVLKNNSVGAFGTVTSVNSVLPDVDGNVLLTKTNIGLSNVDNTSDLNKPVSTAQQAAIDAALLSVIKLQATWDASTNTPDISGTTVTGHAWIVSVAGTTNVGGIASWNVDDIVVKTDTGWLKIAASTVLSKWGSIGGLITEQIDLQNALATKEGVLGNPVTDDMILSSKADGTREWKNVAGGVYTTEEQLDLPTPETVGGIEAGTLAGDLTGKPISKIIDMILFGTVPPSMLTKALTVTHTGGSGNYEVGTALVVDIIMSFFKGRITSADGSGAIDLVGAATSYELFVKGISDGSNANGLFTRTINIVLGNNAISGEVDHAAGTGAYYDSKGQTSNIFDMYRGAAVNISDDAPVINGRYKAFFGSINNAPANSAEVRALPHYSYLSSSNTGTFYVTMLASSRALCFAVPTGKNIAITIPESKDAPIPIDGVYTVLRTLSVNDASGTAVTYDLVIHRIGTSYGKDVDYKVVIS